MSSRKIFSNDKHLPYKSTKLSPKRSRAEIEELLERYGITTYGWTWEIESKNRAVLWFELSDVFQDAEKQPMIRLEPPRIWKPRGDEVDWRLSMRIFFWYLKNEFAWARASQSSHVVAFLPHIALDKERSLHEVLVPRLERFATALPAPPDDEEDDSEQEHVLDVEHILDDGED